MVKVTKIMDSVTCDTKIEIMRASQFRMSHKRSFDGHLQPFPDNTRFSVFWRHTSSLEFVAAQNVVALMQFRERQNLQSILPSSFLLLPTFYSQQEIEVECPLVRLQIYNLNILCLVHCYLKTSLCTTSHILFLSFSLSL